MSGGIVKYRFGMVASELDLSVIQGEVARMGELEDWNGILLFKLNLVLEELGMNVKSYGQVDGRRFDVDFEPVAAGVKLVFSDDGEAFDPLLDGPEVDLESDMSRRRLGGLGIHLVRTMVEGLEYCREDGCNRLSMLVTGELAV